MLRRLLSSLVPSKVAAKPALTAIGIPAIPQLPPGVWPVLPAPTLLQPHQRLLVRIRGLSGVSADYWDSLYQPLLDNFAAFVQQTPASEAHHHCGQGGMLAHSLHVMQLALDARKGNLLPPGAAAEEVNRQQHAWTYAIASAALLHDVGKPCSDQKLRLFDTYGQDTYCYWEPLHGSLQAGCYRVDFVRNRAYRTHELLPPLLARQLTPEKALSWLQQDFPNVFQAWLGYLSGQDEVAGVLGQIVTQADMQSVADDLSGSQPTHTRQIPTAKAKPLSQRLLTGLRHLLDEQQLTLNRPGAAGFFDGDSLWLVSKRVLDELRTHLEKGGQTGIPSRNDRLMDELQQHAILTPTLAGQAIWNATIKTGSMEQAFTLLRIPASRLWADPGQYPSPLDGSITPNAKDGDAATASQSLPAADKLAATVAQASATTPSVPAAQVVVDTDDDWLLPTTAGQASTVPDATGGGDSGSPWGDDELPKGALSFKAPLGMEPQLAHTMVGDPPVTITPAADADDPGRQFLAWLADGLLTGKHPLNTPEAFVHVVREGVLLVSPRAFKEYSPDNWEYVQKRFTKLKLHQPAPNDSNIWQYNVRGQRRTGVVRGILLADPLATLGLNYLPAPNKSLALPG
ncbi:MAG TPA: MobH family relaxase [Candidatus Thiothrix moscowensis]|uniref:MobH family relaxase n=1 Tax=unclassified Thiothrix TaxID=2636184 RepID=UPI0025D57336|nr:MULTISPECIES: MobH family relaxase [unclassified Thiothrix]HRJ52261.1 MobH family relaxase [Candidatus Thiothrix moscowensis]HRJ92576.1 MobH family relaxase [Candidatus Thiothrix moscowensis]